VWWRCTGPLFAIAAACVVGLVPRDFFANQTNEPADLPQLLQLAWFTTWLATLAGALGSLTESDLATGLNTRGPERLLPPGGSR